MPEPTLQVVLVEQELAPPAEREEASRRVLRCLALRDVRWVRSFVTPDGRHSLCQFEAPDAETVREAFRAAGRPIQRAWVARIHAPPPPGDGGRPPGEG